MTRLDRKLWLAAAALLWERLWPALVGPLCVFGLYLLLALTGLLAVLPRAVQIALLAIFAAAFLWSLRDLLTLRLPRREEALRRLELGAGLPHRPATSYFDTLDEAVGDDPATAHLWAAHRERLVRALARLRVGWPSPKVARRDPFALRAALLVSLIAALALAGSGVGERLEDAVRLAPRAPDRQIFLDAWMTPPAYTGKAPTFLTQAEAATLAASDGARAAPAVHKVPAGSELNIRIAGAREPAVALLGLGADPAADGDAVAPRKSGEDGSEWRIPLKQSATAAIRAGGRTVRAWRFDVVPDTPPEIMFVERPGVSMREALTFVYSAGDDYGIASARAEIRRPENKGEGADRHAGLPVAPPDFPLTLPRLKPKAVEQRIYQDITSHPWAGLEAELTLVARDEAGQSARSETLTIKLPERSFEKPLAKALIEQRRTLILDPAQHERVALALDALSLSPQRFTKDSGIHLGLRTAYFRLSRSAETAALLEVADLLWEIALHVEDGDLSDAERELRAAQRALMKALAENASDDEISRLMQRLKQALNRYLQALAKQAQEQMRRGGLQIDRDAMAVRPQDLNRMLDSIESLARSGARNAAQQMLAQLQDMLENMRAGMRMQQGQGQSQLSEFLRELGGLIGKQQQLMDRTFRAQRGAGQDGPRGMSDQEASNLAQQQESLRQMLERMMGEIGRQGAGTPQAFGRAGEAMRDASRALRQREGRDAVGRQGEAIDQMRQGAQSLAQQMLDGMAERRGLNRDGRTGRFGETDPLGRPLRSSGPDLGLSTRVPDRLSIQRAREIMRELQRRLGERGRPPLELDYLERLLRRF